jgi:hypothetical protein
VSAFGEILEQFPFTFSAVSPRVLAHASGATIIERIAIAAFNTTLEPRQTKLSLVLTMGEFAIRLETTQGGPGASGVAFHFFDAVPRATTLTFESVCALVTIDVSIVALPRAWRPLFHVTILHIGTV